MPQHVKQQAEEKAAADAAEAVHAEVKPRLTAGKIGFNIFTYAGITWIANEALSTIIGSSIDAAKNGKAAGRFHKPFQDGISWLEKNANPKKLARSWFEKPLTILVLTVGGSLLVPVVKWFEDRKSPIIRKADDLYYGKKAKTDPSIAHAHEALDTEHKQSWGSLWKSRLLVMGLAIGLDFAAGDKDSPSSKWLMGTKAEKYSNMKWFGTTLSRDILSWIHPNADARAAIKEFRSKPLDKGMLAPVGAREGKVMAAMGGTFGFVLVLSGVLSAIFFASSRVFAALRDKKIEKRAMAKQHGHPTNDNRDMANDTAAQNAAEANELTTRPGTTIHAMQGHMALDAPEPALAR